MKNGDTREKIHIPYVGVPRLRRAGGKGGKPAAKRLALVSSREGLENVAETAVARVARTAKTVVNFMTNNEGRRAGWGASKEGNSFFQKGEVFLYAFGGVPGVNISPYALNYKCR